MSFASRPYFTGFAAARCSEVDKIGLLFAGAVCASHRRNGTAAVPVTKSYSDGEPAQDHHKLLFYMTLKPRAPIAMVPELRRPVQFSTPAMAMLQTMPLKYRIDISGYGQRARKASNGC